MMRFAVFLVSTLAAFAPGPSGSALAQDPISDFLKRLFQAEQRIETRKPVRQAGEAGAGLLLGERAEARLASAVQSYGDLVSKGGWRLIASGPPLRPGDVDERLPMVRARLAATGDLDRSQANNSTEYDPRLAEAVVRFQTRHGLPNKAHLGRRTIAALNVSAESRRRQLEANLLRIRSQRSLLAAARTVIVNIPAFELQAIDQGHVVFSSRVVVGRVDRKTPTISAEIRGVNLLPTWRVPPGITKRDMVPKLVKDPGYFARENFRVIRVSDGTPVNPSAIDWAASDASQVRFEQAPGPNNALGLIRIDMPNPQIVYLHDTPLKKLFDQPSRPFSSGCVRVQKIAELALWLLGRRDDVGAAELAKVLNSGKPQNIALATPVPVHFVYYTAWVDHDGSVNFREDIYGNDQASPLAEKYDDRVLPKQPLSP